MIVRSLLAGLVLGAVLLATAGCVPESRQTRWVNPLDVAEPRLPKDPKDNNYILTRMEFGRTALMMGCASRAKPRLLEAYENLGAERSNLAAALTTEQLKFYRGETYERAMLGIYLGLIEYQAGDYERARIFFARALEADKAAVVNKGTPDAYGEDFGLAYYWLGRTFAKLGNDDNSAIAFRKIDAKGPPRKAAAAEAAQDAKLCTDRIKARTEGEQWAWQTFHDPKNQDLCFEGIVNLAEVKTCLSDTVAGLPGATPDNPVLKATEKREEFLTAAYQNDANFIFMVEAGRGPFKYLTGMQGERTEAGRVPCPVGGIRIYVDGHYAGPAFEVVDLWEQAATQDRILEKDAAQAGKAIAKEVLSYVPYAGSLAGHWNVQGDVRHWTTLPARVYVFAGKIAPGVHSVRVEQYDSTGLLRPRWTNTYFGLPVPKTGEAVIRVAPAMEGDNQLPEAQIKKALGAGVQPGYGMLY